MDPYDNSESSTMGSTERDPEQCEHEGSVAFSEETYCEDQLNISGNSCECEGYFEMPDCVMDIYLLALDGGDESNAALRKISDVYGQKDDKDGDSNCNHNVNPEPCPNESCGCTGSYNGGAGGGTAVCCDNDPCGPYEHGFKDKKRDPICRGCQEDTYQSGLVNKKPESTDKYVPVFQGKSPNCGCGQAQQIRSPCCDNEENTYQLSLPNKIPESPNSYVSAFSPPEVYSKGNDCCNCGNCQGQSGPNNTDANGCKINHADRSTFYADDSFDCPRRDDSCNNCHKLTSYAS